MKILKKTTPLKFKLIKSNKLFIKKTYASKLYNLIFLKNLNSLSNVMLNNYELYQENLNQDNILFYTSYKTRNLELKFYEGCYNTFDSYLTSVELINYNYIKTRYNIKYKYSMFNYFIPFLIKSGNSLFTVNSFCSALTNLYTSLKYSNSQLYSSYLFYNQFKYYIETADDIHNINFLMHWIINIYKPVFDMRCYDIPKMYKKKNDKQFIYKIVYLSDKRRLRAAYKHIATTIKKESHTKFKDRISAVFLDTLLNYKQSYLYLRKMQIYKLAMDL